MAFGLFQKSFAYVEIIFSGEKKSKNLRPGQVGRLLGQKMVDEIASLWILQ
jgi:hypothetical protein